VKNEQAEQDANEGTTAVLDSLIDWLETERWKQGAVDGYSYESGVEYGLRLAQIETQLRRRSSVQGQAMADIAAHRDMLHRQLTRLRDALNGSYAASPEGRAELELIKKALDFDPSYPKSIENKSVTATWIVHLDSTCPSCHEIVDLLAASDFWRARSLNITEHGTARSKAVEVTCPQCVHEFKVDCEY